MSNTFLAVFVGNRNNPRAQAFWALPEAEQKAQMKQGMEAWHGWVEKNKASIVDLGGPLGKTKKVSPAGIEDISNHMGGYTIVRADSAEAAAKLFEGHPHFSIFPGEGVEVMPVMPVPAKP